MTLSHTKAFCFGSMSLSKQKVLFLNRIESRGAIMKSKRYAKVEKSQCVACGACTKECPMGAIRVWRGCYAKIDTNICIGCSKCSKVCPVGCIEIGNREVTE